MKKKRVVKVIQIVLLILALVLRAGYLYLYNHGLYGRQAKSSPEGGFCYPLWTAFNMSFIISELKKVVKW